MPQGTNVSSKFILIKHVNLLNYINRATVLNIINSDKIVNKNDFIYFTTFVHRIIINVY